MKRYVEKSNNWKNAKALEYFANFIRFHRGGVNDRDTFAPVADLVDSSELQQLIREYFPAKTITRMENLSSHRNRLDFDECELRLIPLILASKKPLLGICRGCQILNVAFGGTLYQDIVSQHEGALGHSQTEIRLGAPCHRIRIEEGSVLAELYGSEMLVNSFHHQAVKDLGKGLKVTARAYDGIIEAYEAPDYPFVLGVQWHPEQETNADRKAVLPIFRKFVDACR